MDAAGLLLLLMLVFGAFGLLITAVMRLFPVLFSNNVGRSFHKDFNLYPDIDAQYLNRIGRRVSVVRYICFAMALVCLMAAVILDQ